MMYEPGTWYRGQQIHTGGLCLREKTHGGRLSLACPPPLLLKSENRVPGHASPGCVTYFVFYAWGMPNPGCFCFFVPVFMESLFSCPRALFTPHYNLLPAQAEGAHQVPQACSRTGDGPWWNQSTFSTMILPVVLYVPGQPANGLSVSQIPWFLQKWLLHTFVEAQARLWARILFSFSSGRSSNRAFMPFFLYSWLSACCSILY